MSKPRYHWWSYAKTMCKIYPELKKQHDELQSQRITVSFEQVSHGKGGLYRSTEVAAMRELPPARQKEYDAVSKAIEHTKNMSSSELRLKVVELVLMKQCCTLEGAAMKLYISEQAARRYHTEFIRMVGFCYGLEDLPADSIIVSNQKAG